MAEVLLQNVTKVFDDETTAVDDVSFVVPDGSFVVIVGPSGCGKTTTLRMVAGLETITEGTISIGGRIVNEVHPKDRDIAMVFQNYALYPHMSVRQNLEFALKMRSVETSDRDRRVGEVSAMLELDDLLDRKPKQLSGGQRQRVALGRAIVRDPAVFLFDEPLSNLDAKLRTHTRAELQRLHHELGATSIYVTHDQVEAMTMADVIVVMDQGKIQQVAPPMELYAAPINRFVAGFIGAVGMNFLEGHIVDQQGAIRFVEDGASGAMAIPLGDSMPATTGKVRSIGIRPEHFERTTSDDPQGFSVTTKVVETLGAQTLVHFPTGAGLAVAAIAPEGAPSYGEAISLRIDPARIHLFDSDGIRING